MGYFDRFLRAIRGKGDEYFITCRRCRRRFERGKPLEPHEPRCFLCDDCQDEYNNLVLSGELRGAKGIRHTLH